MDPSAARHLGCQGPEMKTKKWGSHFVRRVASGRNDLGLDGRLNGTRVSALFGHAMVESVLLCCAAAPTSWNG